MNNFGEIYDQMSYIIDDMKNSRYGDVEVNET